jgi:LysR family transcriptional activator of dmlA
MSYFDNIKTFIRVYELGSMSAAARDQRISPAVASARISQLEEHLSVRLFQRTTRMLHPTEQGKLFYSGATRVLEAVEDAEAAVQDITQKPRGTLYVAAPLGIGRRLIAPAIPMFKKQFPLIDIRLRLSDRRVDVLAEGLDLAFFLGNPEDSTLKMRKFATCARLLCAAPEYLAARGLPENVAALTDGSHDCLNLRFPGASEFQWPLKIDGKIQRIAVKGPYESDDGDVLTNWALEGHGIVLKPLFEVQEHLNIGRLIPVLTDVTPTEVQMGCLYPHRKRQDPKTRHFMDFMAQHITVALQK